MGFLKASAKFSHISMEINNYFQIVTANNKMSVVLARISYFTKVVCLILPWWACSVHRNPNGRYAHDAITP